MSHASTLVFGTAITRNAGLRPAAPALSFGERQWTYAELDAWIDNVAAQLGALGVGHGDCVVYLSKARPEVFATMFALARLGAAFVPLHASSTAPEVARVLDDIRPAGIVAEQPWWDKVGTGTGWDHWELGVGEPDASRPMLATDTATPTSSLARDVPNPETTAAVIAHTSGTSGRAKAVRLSHANLMWSAINGLAGLDVGDTDRTLVTTPLSHIAVLAGLAHYTWIRGGQVVLAPSFEVESFFDAVAGQGITLAFAVPTMLELLARHPRFAGSDLDTLRWVLCGGAPMSTSTRQRYTERGTTIVCSYGMTETSAGVTYGSPFEAGDAGVAGAVAPFAEIRVGAADGSQVAVGHPGEILVRGPSVATEYLGPGREPFAAVDAAGWFHTGDWGTLDQHGRLMVSGRMKETIITGGENVDPFEVEEELSRCPGIAEAVVVGVDEPTWGQIVTAVVVTEDGSDADLQAITTLLLPHLSSYKIPRRLVTRTQLPRNATGKILRQTLIDELDATLPSRP